MTKWGAKVLHHKSVAMAQAKKVVLFVGSAANSKSGGTVISEKDIESEQKFLSVNSYSNVFKFKTKQHVEHITTGFFSYINRYQIASPEILHAQESIFYISGPKENLDLIEKVDFKDSNFELQKKDLCSVSITCRSSPTKAVQQTVVKKIEDSGLFYDELIITTKNINFILQQSQKDQALQVLHSLIY